MPQAAVPVHRRPDVAQDEEREQERRDEQPEHDLVLAVAQERAHDARRELAGRELEDEHRDREDEARERQHRLGDRREHAARPLGRAAEAEEPGVVDARRVIDRQEDRGEDRGPDGEQAGNEPQADAQALTEGGKTDHRRERGTVGDAGGPLPAADGLHPPRSGHPVPPGSRDPAGRPVAALQSPPTARV
jgi:hypothetical protein